MMLNLVAGSLFSQVAFQNAALSVSLFRDIIRTLGLVALAATLLGLLVHYAFSMKNRAEAPVSDRAVPPGEVERYRRPTRILHWVHGGAFSILFLTGLINFIELIASDISALRWLHLVSAVVIAAAPFIYLLANWQTTGQGLKEAFNWGKSDIDWLMAVPRYYLRREEDVLPPQGRLNTLQKLWWLSVIFLVPVLIISGAFMWAFGARPVAEWAALFHDLTFSVMGCMFMLHIYVSVVNPLATGGRNESWEAMTTGKVSASHARSYHRDWYDRIDRRR